MSAWFNYIAVSKIVVFGLLVGAALPALFAVGVHLSAAGSGMTSVARRNPVLVVLSWLIFALVVAAVLTGVLFIARDFLGHHTGWYILGAQHK